MFVHWCASGSVNSEYETGKCTKTITTTNNHNHSCLQCQSAFLGRWPNGFQVLCSSAALSHQMTAHGQWIELWISMEKYRCITLQLKHTYNLTACACINSSTWYVDQFGSVFFSIAHVTTFIKQLFISIRGLAFSFSCVYLKKPKWVKRCTI